MSGVIYLSLWEVIGIVSGVFFFLLLLIVLLSYLHQLYSRDTHFSALDKSENGDVSAENYANKSLAERVCLSLDRALDFLNDKVHHRGRSHTALKNNRTINIKRDRKKKNAKKVKLPLNAMDDKDMDEESGYENVINQRNAHPTKTQNLYNKASSSKLTNYTESSRLNSSSRDSNDSEGVSSHDPGTKLLSTNKSNDNLT